MAEAEKVYRLPGEHVHNGRYFSDAFPPDVLDRIIEHEFDDSDIFINTYPKAGTHWLEAVAWMVWSDNHTELLTNKPDHEQRGSLPFLELKHPAFGCGFDIMSTIPAPRLIRSHLPVDYFQKSLTRKKTKFIVLMRNIKDLLVSYYHFYKINKYHGPYTGSWAGFLQMFKEKKLETGDYFEYYLGWWNHRDKSNILMLKFEDVLIDPCKEVSRVAEFMGKDLSNDQIQQIAKAASFINMKAAAEKNVTEDFDPRTLYRKGQVGNWKEHFTVAQNEEIDGLIHEKLHGTGLQFRYE